MKSNVIWPSERLDGSKSCVLIREFSRSVNELFFVLFIFFCCLFSLSAPHYTTCFHIGLAVCRSIHFQVVRFPYFFFYSSKNQTKLSLVPRRGYRVILSWNNRNLSGVKIVLFFVATKNRFRGNCGRFKKKKHYVCAHIALRDFSRYHHRHDTPDTFSVNMWLRIVRMEIPMSPARMRSQEWEIDSATVPTPSSLTRSKCDRTSVCGLEATLLRPVSLTWPRERKGKSEMERSEWRHHEVLTLTRDDDDYKQTSRGLIVQIEEGHRNMSINVLFSRLAQTFSPEAHRLQLCNHVIIWYCRLPGRRWLLRLRAEIALLWCVR